MASWWIKSLKCKSRAFEDVYHPSPKLLMPSYSCRRSSRSVKDVIETRPGSKKSKPDPNFRRVRSSRPVTDSYPPAQPRRNASARSHNPCLPALTELCEGHPSRNVVEIIFHTSWNTGEFSGRVETIFKVKNELSTVARFEEYREAVKSRAGTSGEPMESSPTEENARCVADGNEMMRFYPLGPVPETGGGFGGGAWAFPGGKGAAVCTFSGSGEAHTRAGGGGGRSAMLVCRVIAGRVSDEKDGFGAQFGEGRFGFDSVMGREGELLVSDTRAVLPCFLIIYQL